jgi:hypothetical protein
MIYLLFGEMGVGKNHVGERLARRLDCPFFDGDDAIPDWMVWKIERFRLLSLSDLDCYVRDHLVPAIRSRAFQSADFVAAQALYRRRHRRAVVEGMGRHRSLCDVRRNKVVPVWIRTPSLLTHAGRLFGREHGLGWLMYALATKPFFQAPDKGTAAIDNGTGDDLDAQLRTIAGR